MKFNFWQRVGIFLVMAAAVFYMFQRLRQAPSSSPATHPATTQS